MSNTLKYAEYLKEVNAKASELSALVNNEFGFKLSEVLQSYTSLFTRFCPYKVGDRVQLKKDIDISKDSGWYRSKHFLIKGAISTVEICEYHGDLFSFGLIFDDETYIDSKSGEAKPFSSKHLYYFLESSIEGCSHE